MRRFWGVFAALTLFCVFPASALACGGEGIRSEYLGKKLRGGPTNSCYNLNSTPPKAELSGSTITNILHLMELLGVNRNSETYARLLDIHRQVAARELDDSPIEYMWMELEPSQTKCLFHVYSGEKIAISEKHESCRTIRGVIGGFLAYLRDLEEMSAKLQIEQPTKLANASFLDLMTGSLVKVETTYLADYVEKYSVLPDFGIFSDLIVTNFGVRLPAKSPAPLLEIAPEQAVAHAEPAPVDANTVMIASAPRFSPEPLYRLASVGPNQEEREAALVRAASNARTGARIDIQFVVKLAALTQLLSRRYDSLIKLRATGGREPLSQGVIVASIEPSLEVAASPLSLNALVGTSNDHDILLDLMAAASARDAWEVTVDDDNQAVIARYSVLFPAGKDRLDPSDEADLYALCSLLHNNPLEFEARPISLDGGVIEILGFADNRGDPVSNLDLSLRRARNVGRLVGTFCTRGRLSLIKESGLGAVTRSELSNTDDDAVRAVDRRVEITFKLAIAE